MSDASLGFKTFVNHLIQNSDSEQFKPTGRCCNYTKTCFSIGGGLQVALKSDKILL